MNPNYTPEPITTVNEGDTIPVKVSESLAMEFLNFLYETSVFLSRYVDSVNHFMAETTDKDFQQLDELMRNLDPNDPITIAMAEGLEQAKMLHRIHKELIQKTEENV